MSETKHSLIAAAPDLLAAAENMMAYFEEQPHGTVDVQSQCAFMFRAAIAKARGNG